MLWAWLTNETRNKVEDEAPCSHGWGEGIAGPGGGGGGGGGGAIKKQVSALIWSAHAVRSCFHTSCFRTPTRVIFTEMAEKNAYFPCV